MLTELILVNLLFASVLCEQGQVVKPYIFPIPLELPYRNEKADQCWLRIEDVEIIETLTVYCTTAHEFLRSFIQDYNSRKMLEDGVHVSLWSEDARTEEELPKPVDDLTGSGHKMMDWKVTTVMDPTTRRRLYVTKNADCRLVMCSREGTTNYKVDCARILFFVNHQMSGSAVSSRAKTSLVIAACVFRLFHY